MIGCGNKEIEYGLLSFENKFGHQKLEIEDLA
jgi:hypothetical protein